MDDYIFQEEEHELSMDDAERINDGLKAGAGVLTAIGAVVVAIAGLFQLFSKDD